MARHQLFLGSSTEGKRKAQWLWGLLHDIAVKSLRLERDEFDIVGWWQEGVFPPNVPFIDSLFRQLDRTDSALVLATRDDMVDQRGDKKYRPRDNIILEYGLWSGRFGREKTAIAALGDPELPSDLAGVARLELEDADDEAHFRECNRAKVEAWLKDLGADRGLSGRVFVLFPSLKDDPFYSDLYAGFAQTLPTKYVPVLFCPDNAYSAEEFVIKLREIARHRDEYVGGIIRPMLVAPSAEELRSIIKEWKIPTVFVDVSAYKNHPMPDHVCYLGFDNVEGGRLAAEAMLRELEGRSDTRVLVVASDDQPERRDAFLKTLAVTTEPRVMRSDFDREKASASVRTALQQLWQAEGRFFDGIFCSSDVMALGAITAVSEVSLTDPSKVKDLVIIGYDGTPTAKTLIGLQNNPLRNTVEQNPYLLGARAADLLVRMKEGPSLQPEERVQILGVRIYRSYSKQAMLPRDRQPQA